MKPIKFAYFGTPYVARDTLALVHEHGFIPAVVVTNPDAPRGRGLALTPSETKTWALAHGIPVLTPTVLDEKTIAEIQAFGCEYAVVVAYGKIFPESLIQAFSKGVLNIHYSLLPKYRGASPVESALLAGDTVTGVAIQKMVREMDAGDILALQEVAIEPYETAKELKPRLIRAGANLLADLLPKFERGEITPMPQDVALVTRAHKIKKEDGFLSDLSRTKSRENWNKYRAYAEWPGVYFFENNKRIKITKARFDPSADEGQFIIERVIPEGKPETNYARE
ncbi:MAG: methionyl-tRNA formyltransferase [bacterium]|nr:methionyl-tRNA formyltransferase [bacterium]